MLMNATNASPRAAAMRAAIARGAKSAGSRSAEPIALTMIPAVSSVPVGVSTSSTQWD